MHAKENPRLGMLNAFPSANAVDIEHAKLNTDPATDYITVDGCGQQYKRFDTYDLSNAATALVHK